MRLSSTSSSLILATLAVSSSSAALAAPTESNALDDVMLPSSSDMRVIAVVGRSNQAAAGLEQTPSSESDPIPAALVREFLARRGLLDTLGGLVGGLPVLGPILAPLLQTIGSLVNGLGLKIDAVQMNAADAQPSLTPDQIRIVANAVANAHVHLQALLAKGGGLNARGQLAEWDAVSDPPPASSSSSDIPSSTLSSTSSVPMQRSQTAPTTSGSATSSAGGTNPTLPVLPINPPNTPNLPNLPTPTKPGGLPSLASLASRMIAPVFIKAKQNKVVVSMSDGPAMTFTANSSSTADSSSTATLTSSQATFTSADVTNSTSTAGA